jgi:hypothetical protein
MISTYPEHTLNHRSKLPHCIDVKINVTTLNFFSYLNGITNKYFYELKSVKRQYLYPLMALAMALRAPTQQDIWLQKGRNILCYNTLFLQN